MLYYGKLYERKLLRGEEVPEILEQKLDQAITHFQQEVEHKMTVEETVLSDIP